MSDPMGPISMDHCVCQPYFLDNAGIKTPYQTIPNHTKSHQTIPNNAKEYQSLPLCEPYFPDNALIKVAGYNSFQGCFLGNRLPRLHFVRICKTTSKYLQHISLKAALLHESWNRHFVTELTNRPDSHLQSLEGVMGL